MGGSNSGVEYTIAVCHFNMVDTVERAMRSILDQVDNRFEVLVIDGGSTDGSLKILKELEEMHGNFRLVVGDNDNLAEARNQSFREAKGDYILESMDADDEFKDGIRDFVNIYHQIESNIDCEFFLKGKSVNMAPRDLLLKYQYRSLGYGEDRDLWRRLFAADRIIWLDHIPFHETIRDPYDWFEETTNLFKIRVVDFRSGITLKSYLRWCSKADRFHQMIWRTLIGIVAYSTAKRKGIYGLPGSMKTMGALEDAIENSAKTIAELEQDLSFTFNEGELSDFGKQIFLREVNYNKS